MIPPAYLGVDVDAVATPCDYPAEEDVRFGVDYADGGMTGSLVISALPDPSGQIVALLNTYNEAGNLEDGVKVYHRMVLPPPTVAVYDDAIKESISVDGIVTIPNLFKGAVYQFWRGRSAKIRRRIPDEGELGITPPQNFEAMVIDQDVHLTWEAAFEAELFSLVPILGNDSLDPCLT